MLTTGRPATMPANTTVPSPAANRPGAPPRGAPPARGTGPAEPRRRRAAAGGGRAAGGPGRGLARDGPCLPAVPLDRCPGELWTAPTTGRAPPAVAYAVRCGPFRRVDFACPLPAASGGAVATS